MALADFKAARIKPNMKSFSDKKPMENPNRRLPPTWQKELIIKFHIKRS
jgi:hypothetical protein